MINYKILIFFLILTNINFSQNKDFDKLEKLYDQQHFKIVYKRSNQFLDNPEYDFSLIPLFYKTLTSFQLAQNEFFLGRNPEILNEAKIDFIKMKKTSEGQKIFNAHFFEIVSFKRDLINWLEELKKNNEAETFEFIEDFISENLNEIPDIDNEEVKEFADFSKEDVNSIESLSIKKQREQIISIAMKYIGVKYSFSGNSPKGFDCSGFTSYVYSELKKTIPRSAREQFEKCKKIKEKSVNKGDLIFFTNGSSISHVGIIVSNRGEALVMIHSSSTLGIVVTEIEKSTYWKKKIAGFGTYIME
jgi:cell wall-associated NlpC family hydrolase